MDKYNTYQISHCTVYIKIVLQVTCNILAENKTLQ